jgi:ABC-2 type transport system ATP-binding protein
MEEAERLCDRVAIMDHGNIIALGSPDHMIEEYFNESAIQFKITSDPGHDALAGISGVTNVVREDGNDIILYSNNIPATIASLLDMASQRGDELSDLFVRQATLEDVFLKLTGKRIRD